MVAAVHERTVWTRVKRRTRAAVRHERRHEGAREARAGQMEERVLFCGPLLERIQEFRKIQGVWIDPLMKKKGS